MDKFGLEIDGDYCFSPGDLGLERDQYSCFLEDELALDINGDYNLHDIESMLYSQVFHETAADESDTNKCNPCDNISTSVTSKRQRIRYFGNRIPLDTSSQVQINIDSSNQSQTYSPVDYNNLTILTSSDELFKFSSRYEHMNIVNQYTVPMLIDTNNVINSGNPNCENLENLQPSNIESIDSSQILTRKQKNQLRNKRRRERQKLKQLNKKTIQEPNKKIIFISDDSEDEKVLFIEKTNMASKDINNMHVENRSDSDDDIIYIPPSPIHIINVDEDLKENFEPPENENLLENGNQASQEKSCCTGCTDTQELTDTIESTSNDFLDNISTEHSSTRFNFALHGSDFSNNGEFVQPHNSLVDFCETESSCSTNDQNKDFNNSAKSIVFNEVEFPKEDIFSDKNLDSFSSFITPRRSDKIVGDTSSSGKKKNNILIETDSSTSSTESDYESDARNSNKNLPTLSPMVTSQVFSKTHGTPKIDKKKFKEIPDNSSMSQKSDVTEALGGKTINKLSKKKKKINKSDISLEQGDVETQEEEETDNSFNKKKKRKKNDNLSDETTEISNEDVDYVIEEPNSSHLNISTCYESTGEQHQVKKKKRKKTKLKKSVDIHGDLPDTSLCIASTDTLSLSHSEDTMPTEAILEENMEIINENSDRLLYEINDPSDINLYNESIVERNGDVNIQQGEGKIDDDIVLIDQKESETATVEVIVLDDMSDSSDIELIENVNFNCVDLTNFELGNCNKSVKSTLDLCNLSSNDGSMDYFKDFDLKTIQNKQSDDPLKWQISYKDRNSYLGVGKKGPRCTRCRHFGHFGSRCPEKPYPPCCILCSSTNHQEPRCPNKVCRECGNPGDYSTTYCYLCFKYRHVKCNLCNVPGHIAKSCPDLWRRYHLTTEAGPIIMPNEQVLRPRNQQWCSGCAQQGHLEHECNDTYYHRPFPPTRPDIVTYIDVLNEDNIPRDIPYIPETAPKPAGSNNMSLYGFPFMNNLLTINTNPISSFGRTVAPNSLNSNIIIQVPNSCVPQNVLTSNLMDQMRSNFENQNVNNLNTNLIQQMSHNFQKPVSHVDKTTSISTDSSKFDMKKIQELFMKMPHATVKHFLRKQIEELDTQIVNYNPKVLRHKLFKYDRSEIQSEKLKRDRCYWFRVLNMFIFGIHNLNDGKLHISFIRNFLESRKAIEFDEAKRRSLFSSYSYIFGVDKHTNISYYRLIKLLVDRCNQGKTVKPL